MQAGYHPKWGAAQNEVSGTLYGVTAAVEHVGVDHGGGDVAVTEQLLDGADVVAAFEQVGREAVAQGVRADAWGGRHARGAAGRPLQDGLVEVVAAALRPCADR